MSELKLYAAGERRKRPPSEPRQHRDGPVQAEIIPMLLKHIPGCKAMRWRESAMQAFSGLEEVVGQEDDFWAALSHLKLIPDAYVVYPETCELHFFEVEIRHLLTGDKLKEYARFVTTMHHYGISFEVYTVNQFCHINYIPLFAHYVEWVKEGMPA